MKMFGKDLETLYIAINKCLYPSGGISGSLDCMMEPTPDEEKYEEKKNEEKKKENRQRSRKVPATWEQIQGFMREYGIADD